MDETKAKIRYICKSGTNEQKKALFNFDITMDDDAILYKFNLFARTFFSRYFHEESAPFHDSMILRAIKSYKGANTGDLAFRGSAKTSLRKLFRVYVLLNDPHHHRKYQKVLSRDLKNAQQAVTDIYNMLVELRPVYGDIFENTTDKKREETMSSFTMASGVKVTAGTVGQKQRGHVQDAYRPDWITFDDIEDSESMTSQAMTQDVIRKCDEAINGLAKGGSWDLLGNYISDTGSIQWFLDKKNVDIAITPIIENDIPTWGIYSRGELDDLKNNALDWWGDYMCSPNRAENKFFDVDRIEKDITLCEAPQSTSAGLKYWKGYLPHHRYGLGSDHSEGIGRDANACCLFDFNTGELVASYANNQIAPDLSAHEFARLGNEYGNCVYAPEINNNCGGIVIATLKALGYSNLYKQINETKLFDDRTEKIGWLTTSKSKPTMFFEFKRDYNDGLIKIYDVELLKEMKAYTNNDIADRATGLITRHFDLLTSACIAWQMKDFAYTPHREYRPTGNLMQMK